MADMPVRPPPKWKPPQPWDLPAWREHIVAGLRDPAHLRKYADVLAMGRGMFRPDPSDPDRSAALMMEDECRRLAGARLYSVSGESTAVAVPPVTTCRRGEVRRTDPPSPAGFVVFDAPIGDYEKDRYMDCEIKERPSGDLCVTAAYWVAVGDHVECGGDNYSHEHEKGWVRGDRNRAVHAASGQLGGER